MNVSSPRDMSIYISIIASVIAGVTMVVTIGFTGYYALAVIAAILFIFIVVYIVSYYLLSSFIFEKINPIYKTIHNLNISDNELKRELEEKDLISEVNKEVLHWLHPNRVRLTNLRRWSDTVRSFWVMYRMS